LKVGITVTANLSA